MCGGCCSPRSLSCGHSPYRKMAVRTRPIVRLGVIDRMVTKGYRKGVYERVTKGTGENWRRLLKARERGGPAAFRDCFLFQLFPRSDKTGWPGRIGASSSDMLFASER